MQVSQAQTVIEGNALEYTVTLNTPSRAGQVLKLETLFHNSTVPHDQLAKTADPFKPGEYLANGTVFTRDVKNIAVTPLGNSAAISKHLVRLAQYGPKYYEDAELMKKLAALDRGENVDIPDTGKGAHIGALTALNTEAYNIPIYIVDSNDPAQTYATFSSADPRVLASADIMQHTMGRIPFPTHAKPAHGGDKSFAVYDKATGMMREYFYAEADNGGWKVSSAGYHQAPAGLDELGAHNYWMQLDHGGSSVVMMLNPLSQIGISELMAGKINHAVSVTLPDAMIDRPSFPAKLSDGSDTSRHAVAEGQWFRIKPDVNLDAYLRPDGSGNSKALNPLTLMIAKAAQQYGGYGADRNLHNIAFNAEPAHNYLAQGKENPWRKGGELYQKLQAPGVADPFSINDFPWELVEWMPLDWSDKGADAGFYADTRISASANGIDLPTDGNGNIILPDGVTAIRVKVPTLTHNNFIQTDRVELKAELLQDGQSLAQDHGSGQVLDAPSPFADAAPDGNSDNDILASPKLNTAGFADLKTLQGEALYRYLAEHGADILAQSQDGTASTLRGGAGDDVLIAGRGIDLLEGGPGADTFVFVMNGENSQPYHNNDRILDFNPAEDRIILTRGKDWLQTDKVTFDPAPEVQRLHFKTWLPENPPVIHINAVEIKTPDGRPLSSAEVLDTVRIYTEDGIYRADGQALQPPPPAASTKEAGINLDIARHFYSLQTLKHFVDDLATYGGNFLHLHLSDTENYALESAFLGQTTANATQRADGTYLNPQTGKPFLSHAQIRELIAHAQSKGIAIIPEVDAPAHMKGIYDLVVAKEGAAHAQTLFDTGRDPGYPELYFSRTEAVDFIKALYTEVLHTFRDSGEYFHIGGDEFAVAQGENHQYIAYANTIAAFLREHGLKVRMWNDGALKADLAQLDKTIEITYWSLDGNRGDSAQEAWNRAHRAGVQDLLDHGFSVLNYNDAHLYHNPAEADIPAKGVEKSSDTSLFARNDGQRLLGEWHLGIWDERHSDNAVNPAQLKGAALSIWGEHAGSIDGESIRLFNHARLDAFIKKTHTAADPSGEKAAALEAMKDNDFADLSQDFFIDLTHIEDGQHIDLSGGGKDTLKLLHEEILDTRGTLEIFIHGGLQSGAAESQRDAVELDAATWQKSGTSADYHIYRHGDTQLMIENDITIHLI